MTEFLTADRRLQIEGWLGRTLRDDELVTVGSMAGLTEPQREVARELARKQRYVCLLYLEGVVTSLLTRDGFAYVDAIPGAKL